MTWSWFRHHGQRGSSCADSSSAGFGGKRAVDDLQALLVGIQSGFVEGYGSRPAGCLPTPCPRRPKVRCSDGLRRSASISTRLPNCLKLRNSASAVWSICLRGPLLVISGVLGAAVGRELQGRAHGTIRLPRRTTGSPPPPPYCPSGPASGMTPSTASPELLFDVHRRFRVVQELEQQRDQHAEQNRRAIRRGQGW